jgi:hypothetical protein
MISRKVLCASVALRKASKHFLSATTTLDLFSIPFHTIPYAYTNYTYINIINKLN